jgi:hypothetical protein
MAMTTLLIVALDCRSELAKSQQQRAIGQN